MLALMIIYLSVVGQISSSCINSSAIFYDSYLDSTDKYALDFADGEYKIGYTRGYIPDSAGDVYAAKEKVESCSTDEYHCFFVQGLPFVVPKVKVIGGTFQTHVAHLDIWKASDATLVYAIECSPITKPNCLKGPAGKNRIKYKYTVNAENKISDILIQYIVNGKVVESHHMKKEDSKR